MDKFIGFDVPRSNYSKMPHSLIDALPLITSEAELKIILYVLRHTWGFKDEDKRISIDEFCSGRKRKDGARIDNGVGMSANSVKDGIARAVEHGFIGIEEDNNDLARIKRYYSLNIRGSEVDPLEGQKLTPDPSEVDPRSEKETRERNQRKKPNDAGKPREPRPRDLHFEALADVTNLTPPQRDWRQLTKTAAGQLNKYAKELRDVGATPDQIHGFLSWFKATDWRGKGGQRPAPADVVKGWMAYQKSLNGDNGNGSYQRGTPQTPEEQARLKELGDRINAGNARRTAELEREKVARNSGSRAE